MGNILGNIDEDGEKILEEYPAELTVDPQRIWEEIVQDLDPFLLKEVVKNQQIGRRMMVIGSKSLWESLMKSRKELEYTKHPHYLRNEW